MPCIGVGESQGRRQPRNRLLPGAPDADKPSQQVKAQLMFVGVLLMLGSTLLSACGAATNPPAPSPPPTRWPTPDLTQTLAVVRATITALLPTIPTITPIPGIDPATEHMLQQEDLYHRALMTAVPG